MYDDRPDIRNRVIALIAIFVVVLGALAFRLWSMQIINGASYAKEAKANTLRDATTIAPRGRIFDRNGKPLVVNRSTMAVLAPANIVNDKELVGRLAKVLGITTQEVIDRASTQKESALELHQIAIDVPMNAVSYISEHQSEFEGVEVQARAVRTYPNGAVAANVLGYTGEISDTDLNSPDFKGYNPTDIVGKTGAERSFESVLQGVRGRRVMEVNASGVPQHVVEETAPEPGQDIRLTIDLDAQKVAEKAVRDAIKDARKKGYKANAGSAVALDVTNGEVLAMASYPTYNPEEFINGISQEKWKAFNSKSSNYPLTNRAISSTYPPASTFKSFTGLAALNSGLATPATTVVCKGLWTGLGKQWGKWCWKHSGHGTENLRGALMDSCDSYFYELGLRLYKANKEALQKMARSFGYGSKLGIDLPGEVSGRVPDKKWKAKWNENYPEYKKWLPGDTVNMSIGQGDMLATPLQIAASYAGIAQDGTIYRPHVLKSVLDSEGKTVISTKRKVAFKSSASANTIKTVQNDLHDVVASGTASSAFRGFSIPVSGKTGTAQKTGQDDYAVFVCYAPSDKPRYAVSVVIEQGGSGGGIGGPAARQILAQLFGQKVNHVTATDNSR